MWWWGGRWEAFPNALFPTVLGHRYQLLVTTPLKIQRTTKKELEKITLPRLALLVNSQSGGADKRVVDKHKLGVNTRPPFQRSVRVQYSHQHAVQAQRCTAPYSPCTLSSRGLCPALTLGTDQL